MVVISLDRILSEAWISEFSTCLVNERFPVQNCWPPSPSHSKLVSQLRFEVRSLPFAVRTSVDLDWNKFERIEITLSVQWKLLK